MKKAAHIDLNEFESVLIYKIFTDSNFIDRIKPTLKLEYFGNESFRKVAKIIFDFHTTRQTIPNLTELKLYLHNEDTKKAFAETVAAVKEIDRTKSFDENELICNTETFIKERGVYKTMEEAVVCMTSDKTYPPDIVEQFEKVCNISLQTSIGTEVFEDIESLASEFTKSEKRISTGFQWLDEKIGGGFVKDGRALYLFPGVVNVGKSIFLGNIAMNICRQGYNVLLISLEMSELMYAQRICSGLSNIPMSELRNSKDALIESIRAQKENGTYGKLMIKEFPPSTVTPGQLQAFIKQVSGTGIKIDAIIVDYLNLLTMEGNDEIHLKVKNIAEKLRAMSYIFSCPVISSSQFNRGAYDKEDPGMVDMSESNGTNATADFIGSLWRHEDDEEMDMIRLSIAKSRFGAATGTMFLHVDYLTLTVKQHMMTNSDTVDLHSAVSEMQKLASPA